MTLYVHKERTDAINMAVIANDFVQHVEGRTQIFGQFTDRETVPN